MNAVPCGDHWAVQKGKMKGNKRAVLRHRKVTPWESLVGWINENDELKALLQLGGAIQLGLSAGSVVIDQLRHIL